MVKGKGAPSVEMLGCAYEPKLGGHFADIVIVQAMLEEAKVKIPGCEKSTKALRKLISQAQKTKLVLSSNKEALFKVEALYDDKDFSKSIPRSTFEEMLTKEGWFERIPKVIEAALARAGVDLAAVTQVEMIGGGWRIPKVEEAVGAYFTEKGASLTLGKHLNGEEAMVLGALQVATNGSATYRSVKTFFTDVFEQSYHAEVYNLTEDGAEDEATAEFRKTVKLGRIFGQKKKVSFPIAEQNVGVSFFEDGELVATSTIKAATVAKKLVEDKDKWEGTRLRVIVGSDPLGIIGVREAIVTAEKSTAWEEREASRKQNETEAEQAWQAEVDELKKKNETEPDANMTLPPKPKKTDPRKKPNPPEKRAVADIKWVGYVMSEDEADSLKAKRKEMEQREADVAKVEELANDLEARLYGITDKLEDKVWDEVTSEEQRAELKKAVDDGKEFLETDTDRDYKTYKGKADAFDQLIDPITERISEQEQRPDTKKYVANVLSKLAEAKTAIEEKMPWVEAEKVEKAWTKVEEFQTWWEKKDAQQDSLAAYEAPAYRCKDAEKQAQALVEEFDKLRKTKKPKEKKNATDKKPKDKKKDKKDKKDKKAKKKKGADTEETTKPDDEEPVLTKEELKAKIAELSEDKAKAVEEEDYDRAAFLKAEMAALEAKLSALDETGADESGADEGGADEGGADETAESTEL
jgi:hypoxia up-regulated 1